MNPKCGEIIGPIHVVGLNAAKLRGIWCGLATGFMALIFTSSAAQTQPTERLRGTRPPNIVFVIADQWRFEAFGYAGNPDVKTPNLDRLQRRAFTSSTPYQPCRFARPPARRSSPGNGPHARRLPE